MKNLTRFDAFNESAGTGFNSREFWEGFAKEMKMTLVDAESVDESRTITLDDDGQEIVIEQSWRHDGSSSKPVTSVRVYPYEPYEIGRFAIIGAKEYAEDISKVIQDILKQNESQIFEATPSKGIDVENEQKKQTQFQDQIKIARNKISKVDAIPGKKQFEKTLERSKLTTTIAKLTAMIANSMNKEAQALQALSKEQQKL